MQREGSRGQEERKRPFYMKSSARKEHREFIHLNPFFQAVYFKLIQTIAASRVPRFHTNDWIDNNSNRVSNEKLAQIFTWLAVVLFSMLL